MIKNWFFSIYRHIHKLDCLFLVLLFTLPLICMFLFEQSLYDVAAFSTLFLAIWFFLKSFYSKFDLKGLSLFDIGILLLMGYSLLHFNIYSEVTYLYSKLWIYLFYFSMFFMLRWLLSKKNITNFYVHFISLLILSVCLIQSIIGFLQYYEFIEVNNPYFKLLGSFSSPNLLGAYLGLGFNILIWYFFIYKIKRKLFIICGTFCLVYFGFLIILSNSRATWLALIGSMILLYITSKRNIVFLKKLSTAKKIIGGLLLILLLVFGSKFLYSLKSESVEGRALVAKISLQEIVKKPIIGHGLFSFSGEYNKAKAKYFITKERSWNEIKNASYVFTPFNDYILIAYELGAVVLLFLLVLMFFIIKKIKINPESQMGLALVFNICVLALFTSPLNSISLMLVGIFGFALIFRFGKFKISFFNFSLRYKKMLYIFIFIISSIGIYIAGYQIANKNKFNDYYTSHKDSLEREMLIKLSKPLQNNGSSDFFLGKSFYELGHKKEGYAHMEKVYKMTSAPKIGKVLAAFYLKDGNYKRAEEIYRFNIAVEPYRYEARMDLLSLLIKSNRYNEVVKLSQEIIDFPIKIPSVKIEGYKKDASRIFKFNSKHVDTITKLKGSVSNSKIINSKLLNKILPYKVYLPPIKNINKKLPVIYANDGYNYIKNGHFPEVLDSLIINDIIEPIAVVFLDPKDKRENWRNVRQELFLCNPIFVDFFTKEFLPMIEKRYPISNKRKDRTVLGLSFGGLAAAYLADSAPKVFSNIAMQSPAFHPCGNIYRSYAKKPKKDFKIYLSYGTGKDTERQDIPMIKILKSKGYELKVDRIVGGNHKWETWKEQLDDILLYFFKKE